VKKIFLVLAALVVSFGLVVFSIFGLLSSDNASTRVLGGEHSRNIGSVQGIRGHIESLRVSLFTTGVDLDVFGDEQTILRGQNRFSQRGAVQNVRTENNVHIYSFGANSFTGLRTLRAIHADSGFVVNVAVTSGRFKLVLVGGNRVMTIAEGSVDYALVLVGENHVLIVSEDGESQAFEFAELSETNHMLRIVGDDAEFNLEVRFL